MLRNHIRALIILSLLVVWPVAGAETTIAEQLDHARAALLEKNLEEAGRDLRAASKQLEEAAVNGPRATKAALEASAEEIEQFAEDVENGTAVDTQRLDAASTRARQALARESLQTTSLHTLFRDLGGDFKHLPSRDSLIVAAVGGGLALGAHPFDSRVNQHLANDAGFFTAGDIVGSTATLMGASLATYGLGRATGHPRAAHMGLDLLRAQIITEATVETIKFSVRRQRPDRSSGYAFPSGHSAMTFATATVIERHLGWRWSIPAYGVATYVAMSRLHDNVHSLSDVVFGASVGIIAGRTVTRHGRSNFALFPVAAPDRKEIALVITW